MEISVQCPCGTKFKFDVEPVYGRMPMPATCPSCGADRTDLANEFIRSTSSGTAPTVPTAQAIPIAPAAPAPAAPAPAVPAPVVPAVPAAPAASSAASPLAGGSPLRLSRVEPLPSETTPPPPPPPPRAPAFPAAPGGRPITAIPVTPSVAQPKQKLGLATLMLMIFCVGFGAWHMSYGWFHGVKSLSDEVKAAADSNFGFEDATVLFIKHTNQMEVSEAVRDYWNSNLKKSLAVLKEKSDDEEYGDGVFELWNEHNGFVQLYGGLDWPEAQYEGLAQYLSKRFDTLVFEARSEEDEGTNHFGVYESGVRKFHAKIVVDENGDSKVKTEGDQWAIDNGFKPGKDGFKEFDMMEADKLTQHAGMKVGDAGDEVDHHSIWLQEVGHKRKPKEE